MLLFGQVQTSSMEEFASASNEQKDGKTSQSIMPEKSSDAFITEVATSYGLSADELKEEAINFIGRRTTMMHERSHHAGLDKPTSIDDLIVVKKADPNTFINKFNAFLRASGENKTVNISDFDFNYPMFLVPLETD